MVEMPERIDPKTRTCTVKKKNQECGIEAYGFWIRPDRRTGWPVALCSGHAWELGVLRSPQSPLYK
jgi:hypothetical protein